MYRASLGSSAYESQEEVIDRALDALHAQDEWLMASRHAIDAKIRARIQELEHGEDIPEEDLDECLVRLRDLVDIWRYLVRIQ